MAPDPDMLHLYAMELAPLGRISLVTVRYACPADDQPRPWTWTRRLQATLFEVTAGAQPVPFTARGRFVCRRPPSRYLHGDDLEGAVASVDGPGFALAFLGRGAPIVFDAIVLDVDRPIGAVGGAATLLRARSAGTTARRALGTGCR